MKITFLGTGTSQGIPVVACNCRVCQSDNPLDKRLRSSVLVEINGLTLVIDAGPDFRQQMLHTNVKNLSGILLTHEHYDHIAGLDDIRAFNWVQQRPADIYAEHRVHQSVKRIFSYVFASKKYPGIPQMNLHEISEKPFQIETTTIVPVRAYHLKLPILGYRIGNFAYLTDIKTIEKRELKKIEGVEVLVVNALRREPHISHMTLDEALALIREVTPPKALLTHLGHQMGMHEEISALLPPNVSLAYDGLELVL